MQALTDYEKQFLAFAIQGLCMRDGPELFATATRIAVNLGLLEELQSSLRDWLAFPKEEERDERIATLEAQMQRLIALMEEGSQP